MAPYTFFINCLLQAEVKVPISINCKTKKHFFCSKVLLDIICEKKFLRKFYLGAKPDYDM